MNNINNHRLTKREKYLLKKQRKEKERFRETRRKKIRKIIFISLPVILITVGIIFGLINYLSRDKKENYSGTPKIEINLSEYDAGTISMGDGKIQHTYEIKNIGGGDLKIDKIWTSCMCTTTRLKIGDKDSGEFGMHSKSLFRPLKIAPGETGYLEVTFDPAFHGPEGTGRVLRAVYLSTNDSQNEKAEVRLIVDVVE